MMQRVISALVLAPLVLLVVWVGQPLVSLLIAVAVPLGLREFYSMAKAGGHQLRPFGYVAALGFVAAVTFDHLTTLDLVGAALTLAVLGTLLSEIFRSDRSDSLRAWALTLAGSLYTGWLISSFILLRNLNAPALNPSPLSGLSIEPGAAWIFLVFAVTWGSDIGAFQVGRTMGKRRMAPQLSPKKSWEGFVGGVVTSTLAGMAMVWLLGLPISLVAGALLGAIGSAVATVGDLAESLLKRQVGVKDSGALIPGHGGLLDRIDSLLFTGPTLYYLILLAVELGL